MDLPNVHPTKSPFQKERRGPNGIATRTLDIPDMGCIIDFKDRQGYITGNEQGGGGGAAGIGHYLI